LSLKQKKSATNDELTNPFESGQIKNYLLLYGGVVVIMVLFFIATTLFNEPGKVAKKEFNTELNATQKSKQLQEINSTKIQKREFKLLKNAY